MGIDMCIDAFTDECIGIYADMCVHTHICMCTACVHVCRCFRSAFVLCVIARAVSVDSVIPLIPSQPMVHCTKYGPATMQSICVGSYEGLSEVHLIAFTDTEMHVLQQHAEQEAAGAMQAFMQRRQQEEQQR